MSRKPTVLIIDDDPSHLRLYSWVIERGGFRPLTALVERTSLQLPTEDVVDAAVIDYRLGGEISAVDVIERVKNSFPTAPVVVLSDMFWMPDDVAPFAAAFVRKGEPEVLISTLAALIAGENVQPSAS